VSSTPSPADEFALPLLRKKNFVGFASGSGPIGRGPPAVLAPSRRREPDRPSPGRVHALQMMIEEPADVAIQ